MRKNRTSSAVELLVTIQRGAGRPLRSQIEGQLREAIRAGRLSAGNPLPSSRILAIDLNVSRGVVVEAYSQLVAEGYLETVSGAGTRVAVAARAQGKGAPAAPAGRRLLYDFRPGQPDLTLFPRAAWSAALRHVLREAPAASLGYGDPRGAPALRESLRAYLGRVRGVVAVPECTIVSAGFAQALGLTCGVLRARGVRRIALEALSHPDQRGLIAASCMEVVPIPVDEDGLRVEELVVSGAGAVLVTPAHQFPTGVVLALARRAALLSWARDHDALVLEDDYDAEYRYDRAPVGALQGLAPDHVVYAGSASKMLAPARRLGWLVAPRHLADTFAAAKRVADLGSPGLDQLMLAWLIETGALDRLLRRVRKRYRARRDALVHALRTALPTTTVRGIAAGLHALVELPAGLDERRVVEVAARQGVGVVGLQHYSFDGASSPPALVLGYAALTEAEIVSGIAELARVVRALDRST